MIRFAGCKINIGLDILRRRPDGYHDISTVMYPVPWHDCVEIIEADGDTDILTVYGRTVPCPPGKNLVMKAAAAMRRRFPAIPPLALFLQKNLPDGAGLGGGSSDASAVILLLNDIYSLGLSREEMAEIAATLGADCPFFIYDRPMLCTGTGTTMQPFDLDLSGLGLLIAKPKSVSISTAQAYAGTKPSVPAAPIECLLSMPIEEWQGKVKNDFEVSIFPLAPQAAEIKSNMLADGAIYASLTGSGSAVYGIFADTAAALAAKSSISAAVAVALTL